MTLSDAGLVRYYDRLESKERFRAWLEAAGRDDQREQERLVESCPQRVPWPGGRPALGAVYVGAGTPGAHGSPVSIAPRRRLAADFAYSGLRLA